MILVVEDDPEVRELLELFLKDEGHRVVTASDGRTALDLVARGAVRPDLILADYNLPNGMDGLQLVAKLRERLHRAVPGHHSDRRHLDRHAARHRAAALRAAQQAGEAEGADAGHPAPAADRRSPDRLTALHRAAHPAPRTTAPIRTGPPVIFVVDDDDQVRDAIREVLEDDGRTVEDFATCEAFLAAYRPGREACLVIDAYLPGMSGLELLQRLRDAGHRCRPS